jgi:hypothetical protein
MAKLTKKQTAEIESILSAILRAKSFIDSDKIAICRVESNATTSLHYKRDNQHHAGPAALYPIMKEAGSDWCLADDAVRRLMAFLRSHSEHSTATPRSQ